jgi:hypothetical protein
MEKYYGYIYKITNLVNGKIYVGKSSNLESIDTYFGSGKLIKYAIKKYGVSNFKKEILEFCHDSESLDTLEKHYILILESGNTKKGYNLAEGGEGGNTYKYFSEERKKDAYKKMADTIRGRKLPEDWKRKISESNKGKTFSEETKRKMRGKSRGLGVPKSEEHRKKIGESNKGKCLGKIPSEATRLKMSISKKEKNKLDEDLVKNIIHDYTTIQSLSCCDLEKMYHVPRARVRRTLLENGVKLKTNSDIQKNKFAKEKNKKSIKRKLISPNGEEFYSCGNFHELCAKLKVNRQKMYSILNGKIDNWKGWKCINL